MPLSNAQMRDVQSVLHPYTNLVKFRDSGPRQAPRKLNHLGESRHPSAIGRQSARMTGHKR